MASEGRSRSFESDVIAKRGVAFQIQECRDGAATIDIQGERFHAHLFACHGEKRIYHLLSRETSTGRTSIYTFSQPPLLQ